MGGGGVSKKVQESRLRLNGYVMRRAFVGSMAHDREWKGMGRVEEGGRRGGVCLGRQCESNIDLFHFHLPCSHCYIFFSLYLHMAQTISVSPILFSQHIHGGGFDRTSTPHKSGMNMKRVNEKRTVETLPSCS